MRLSWAKVLSISESPSEEPTRYTMPIAHATFQVDLGTLWSVQLLQGSRGRDVAWTMPILCLRVQSQPSPPKAAWSCASRWSGTGFVGGKGSGVLHSSRRLLGRRCKKQVSKSFFPANGCGLRSAETGIRGPASPQQDGRCGPPVLQFYTVLLGLGNRP